MWKWTDSQNIKVLILDANSLNEEYLNFKYSSFNNSIIILKVRQGFETIISHSSEISTYLDTDTLLAGIMEKFAGVFSTSIIAISSDITFLKSMMRKHIGTILTGNITDANRDYIPDFSSCTTDKIQAILENRHNGYASEVIACYGHYVPKMSLIKYSSQIYIGDYQKTYTVYSGGRYYARGYNFYPQDPLSFLILKFKNEYIREMDEFFDIAIKNTYISEKADLLTYVPISNSELKDGRFDRFASLKLPLCSEKEIKPASILEYDKKHAQKSYDALGRITNVKDAFSLKHDVDVKGKTIIIIDDIITTGSTSNEIARLLYKNEAEKVIFIVAGLNQRAESYLAYKYLKCSHCNNDMILRINFNLKMFFGCKHYTNHSSFNTTLNLQDGLQQIRNINQLSFEDLKDTDEEY